ncbi:MAG: hypothetical protein ACI9NT_000031 [Bacteroidia bacterium]|jgi:hypothetical protein
MSMAEATTFLGWCTVLSMSLLALTALCLAVMRAFVISVHTGLYDIPEDQLKAMYFDYMAKFKLLIIVFNLLPYCALKIMG